VAKRLVVFGRISVMSVRVKDEMTEPKDKILRLRFWPEKYY
jgi:hypothetical protein